MKCVLNSSVETITCVRNENGKFIYPLCSRLFIIVSSVSKHLRNIHNKEEEKYGVEKEISSNCQLLGSISLQNIIASSYMHEYLNGKNILRWTMIHANY